MNPSSDLETPPVGLYGQPPLALAEPSPAAIQFSPLTPGASRLEDIAPGGLAEMTISAPPGAVERRYVLAQALRILPTGARLLTLAPKDRGGSRLKGELEAFGCEVTETAKRHHRICLVRRPAAPVALEEALDEGGPRQLAGIDLWTQPGVFSWDRIDPGSALLISTLPALKGAGADMGCGIGVLARTALAFPAVTRIDLIDLDRRALDAARRNVDDPRAAFRWADLRSPDAAAGDLDFVVMNPPFHDGGRENHGLGQRFVAAAAAALRKGGICWMVANRHLPYEATLSAAFASVQIRADSGGYKVFEARR